MHFLSGFKKKLKHFHSPLEVLWDPDRVVAAVEGKVRST